MDEKGSRFSIKSSGVNQLLRRLRYQGAAQWVTLILVASCVGLFMFTASFNSSLNRRQALDSSHSVEVAGSDDEIGADSENALVPLKGEGGKAAPAGAGADELPYDLVEEAVPEFTGLNFWDGVDWDDPLELPDKVAGAVFEMTVETGEEDIELKNAKGDIQVLTVYFRESIPKTKSKMDILLLHGSRFNSETWITVDTTKTFAAMGYRATAIDLPGFGNSAGQVMFGESAVQFIEAFCEAHGMRNPVIVAPSMSGGYALPYLMSRPYNVTALIALAPTSTERYKPNDYLKIQVPILTIYGTKDSTFGSQVQRRLGIAPNSQTKLIQDAHHATYLDQPDEWHRVAYILFRRLDAWAEKNRKAGITTTQHPPVVTHSIGETLPPEIILPPLNVPPMRKFINENGFDELPSGTPPPVPKYNDFGTMADLYGQVSSLNGKPITPEEAAKIHENLLKEQGITGMPSNKQGNVVPQPAVQAGGDHLYQSILPNSIVPGQNLQPQNGLSQVAQTGPAQPALMQTSQMADGRLANQPPLTVPFQAIAGVPANQETLNPALPMTPLQQQQFQQFQSMMAQQQQQLQPAMAQQQQNIQHFQPGQPQVQQIPKQQAQLPQSVSPVQPGSLQQSNPQVTGPPQPPIVRKPFRLHASQQVILDPGHVMNFPQSSLHSNGPPPQLSNLNMPTNSGNPYQMNAAGKLYGQEEEIQQKVLQAAQQSQLNQPNYAQPAQRSQNFQRSVLQAPLSPAGAMDPGAGNGYQPIARRAADEPAPQTALKGLKPEFLNTNTNLINNSSV